MRSHPAEITRHCSAARKIFINQRRGKHYTNPGRNLVSKTGAKIAEGIGKTGDEGDQSQRQIDDHACNTFGGVQDHLLLALGRRVRQLREKKGYSQEAFADAAGLHRTFMGSVERGERNLSFSNLHRIAQALEITLSRLLVGVEDKA